MRLALDNAILIGAIGAEAAVCVLLLFRKVWRNLPVFFAFAVWTLTSDLLLFLIRADQPDRYYNIYMIQTVLDSALQFGVLVELFWSVLLPVRASLPKATPLVLAGLLAMIGVLIWPLAGMTVSPNVPAQIQVLQHVEETFAILRIACFLLMASFSQVLSIGWRDRELQVATGLGIYSIVSLIVSIMRAHAVNGMQFNRLSTIEAASYLGTLSYWVYSFSAKVQERKEFSPQMQHLLLQMGGGAHTGRIALTEIPSERSRKKD